MMMMMMIEYNILRLHLCERLYKISINITPLCNRDTKEATQISVNFEFAVPRFDKSVGFLAWTLSWPMKLAYIIARLAKDNMFKVISWIKASPSNCHLAERGYDSHGSCVFSVCDTPPVSGSPTRSIRNAMVKEVEPEKVHLKTQAPPAAFHWWLKVTNMY